MSNDFLTPIVRTHWDFVRARAAKLNREPDCACGMCQIAKSLTGIIQREKREAYEEGFMAAHKQHATEDQRLGRRTQAILLNNPYKEEK